MAKRGSGEGSIRQRKDGRYEGRYRDGAAQSVRQDAQGDGQEARRGSTRGASRHEAGTCDHDRAGVRPKAKEQGHTEANNEQGRSPEATASEEVRCGGTRSIEQWG